MRLTFEIKKRFFAELRALCQTPGFLRALAALSLHDNFAILDLKTGRMIPDTRHPHEVLSRSELLTLQGLRLIPLRPVARDVV